MKLESVHPTLQGLDDYPLPRMIPVEQKFRRDTVEDVAQTIKDGIAKVPGLDLKGKRIAITAGSRGIPQVVPIYKAIVAELKVMGAEPFLVPTMGSHAGGTAEGQRGLIEEFGLTEEALGVPILSSMDTVQVASLDDGTPVYCDRNAAEADGIVVLNKVKPHTNFKSDFESGMAKMMAIGLGKHKGAVHYHQHGFARFGELIPAAASAFMKATNVVFGVALVESAYDELALLEVVPQPRILEREKEILDYAKRILGQVLVPTFDVLIVDAIGKNYSGQGMDPNVTGRASSGLPGFPETCVQRIVIRDLTEATHGNAAGVGNADLIPMRVADKINFDAMYTNAITATNLAGARMPVVLNTDKECLAVACMSCVLTTPETVKVIRVPNTKKLFKIWMSESYLSEINARDDLVILGDPQPMVFDEAGNLVD